MNWESITKTSRYILSPPPHLLARDVEACHVGFVVVSETETMSTTLKVKAYKDIGYALRVDAH